MKYSQGDIIFIGLFTAFAIITLVLFIIKLLPQNKERFSAWSVLRTAAIFVLDIVMLLKTLL